MAIASRSVQCLRHFECLAEEAQNSEGEPPLSASAVGDELGRFKIWAGNIGAFQRDSRSLDYRLREASQVGDQVTKILEDLDSSLQECTEIVSGRRAQKHGNLSDGDAFKDDFSDISDSDGSGDPSSSGSGQEPVSELSQLFLAITEAITSLYKLSITIRNPTPRDRYAKAASSTPFDVSYDVGHVYEKFPHIRSKAWLMDRLGRAVTRRREFLRYREKHREKIGGNIRPSTDLDERHERADNRRNVTYNDGQTPTGDPTTGLEASSVSRSQFASTKATTYVANLNDENLDKLSAVGRSETSYVTSIAEENSGKLRQIPDPPKESANGMPFECPYCFTIQSVRNSKYWRKHLLSDLKPYICTFEDCSAHLFDRRQMWFQHEMDKHRKEWRCKFCSCELFASAASLESHLQEQHSEYTQQQTLSLVALCEQIPENVAASACPFCDWDTSLREQAVSKEDDTQGTLTKSNILAVSLEHFQRHVGDHLEQLALFAIPPPMEESSGASSNRAAASHNSDHTLGSYVVSEISAPIQDAPPSTQHKAPNQEEDYCPICYTSLALMTDGSDDARASHIATCIESHLLAPKQRTGILKVSQPQALGRNIFKGKGPDRSGSTIQLVTQAKGKATEGRLGRIWSTIYPFARRRKQGSQPDNETGFLLEDHAIAMFNFQGAWSGDLSFRKGDIITVTKRTESTRDWWTGKIGFKTGNFPGDYVEVLPPGWKTDLVRGQSIPESTLAKKVRFDNRVGITTFSQAEQPSTLYYGVSLEELCQREQRPVPRLITDCVETIERHGMYLEEVYLRTNGNEDLTDYLRAVYNQNHGFLFSEFELSNNVEIVTHLLKDFIWQLPGLLIPRKSLAKFVRAAQFVVRQRTGYYGYEKGEGQATTELQAAIRELPQVNRNVFEFLILHFKRVADKAQQNTMTTDKLAAALAPSFKGGVDSGAAPKIPLADLTWALEYIIRRGEFWFRDLDKRLDTMTEEPKAA